MNTKEITILTTWKWEVFELDMKYEDYLILETKVKWNWEDWFNSSKYRQKIKFASIETVKWKTLYLALPEPKKQKKQYTDEQRKENVKKIRQIANITIEMRQKRFIEKRNQILNNLHFEELELWLESTKNKLSEYNKLKNEILLNNSK